MSAPVIWMGFPLLASILLAGLYRHPRLATAIGSLLSAALAFLAWRLPIGEAALVGSLEFKLESSISILGRPLTLENSDRPLLVFFFLAAFFWFTASQAAGVHRLFVPLGMVILVLIIAALAVEPFLFAALFIEIAVLISVPLLYPPGSTPGRGIVRYLIFQTLGMPFILFTGWMLTGLEAGSASVATNVRAGVMLGLGFAFLLAVFPFYSWIPLLVQQVNPYAGGFILFILPTGILLFGLTFFDQYTWIRSSADLPNLLSLTGTLMIVTGGLWSLFQDHLGRIFGYAVIVETGFSLLAAGLGSQEGYASFALLLVPRLAALVLWALALGVINQKAGTLQLSNLHSLGRINRLPVVGLLVAQVSLAGLPLLASFPVKLNLIAMAADRQPSMAAWILAGVFGCILTALRTAYGFYQPVENQVDLQPGRWQKVLMAAGIGLIILIGVFPQVFLEPFTNLLQAFQTLSGQ